MDERRLERDGSAGGAAVSQVLAGTSYGRVRDVIRADIVNGSFGAGARLKAAELAERYGVSQVPVREALQQLQGEGLVVIEPNRGARVRRIDEKFISDLFEIREAVAGMLAAKAALTMTPQQLDELDMHEAEFERAVERGDVVRLLRANILFHRTHLQAADNPEGEMLMDRHLALIQALRTRVGFSPARMGVMAEEHRAIIAALRCRDAATAAEMVRYHTRGAMADMLAQARQAATAA